MKLNIMSSNSGERSGGAFAVLELLANVAHVLRTALENILSTYRHLNTPVQQQRYFRNQIRVPHFCMEHGIEKSPRCVMAYTQCSLCVAVRSVVVKLEEINLKVSKVEVSYLTGRCRRAMTVL